MSDTPIQLDEVVISGGYISEIPGTDNVWNYDHRTEFDGVWMDRLNPDGKVLESKELSYDDYEQMRQQHPELNLPKLKPPPPATNPQGNTQGRVYGEAPVEGASADEGNDEVDEEDEEEAGADLTGEDIASAAIEVLSHVLGANVPIAGIKAANSLINGDVAGALMHAAEMVPLAKWVGTAVKLGKLAGKANKANKTVSKSKKGKDGAKSRGRGRCILRPYRPDLCKAQGLTGHHVVPDRAFRLGPRQGANRQQIPGGISEAQGLVICVKGKGRQDEHGRIHKIYDQLEKKIGAGGTPKGTASLLELEIAAATSVSRVTKCKAKDLTTQLRAYHQANGMDPDFVVRADPYGALAKTIPMGSLGSKGSKGPGQF
ncbi:hypothetical protein [Pseudomonas aeruginosa]|uniref:hypothetical protein n=1 Tax=Pseudomonas aeruginosa TaxID=287 RepID=UPI00148C3809|nr:hypothetical protein [Pseudomonas aeruginosa]